MEKHLRVQDKVYLIDQLPLFAGLSSKEKLLIASNSTLVEYVKGDMVYKQGAASEALYCIVTGRVRMFIVRGNGTEETLDYLKRGSYFGIISLLTKEPHSASVKVVNDAIILKIEKEHFYKAAASIPRFAVTLSQSLSRRLRKKELGEKRMFESTIISVYGISNKIGVTTYAMNLALSLRTETRKNVILVEVGRLGGEALNLLGFGRDRKPLLMTSPFFSEDDARNSIFKHASGIDLMNILHHEDEYMDSRRAAAILSYLTDYYHYIILDLPADMDKELFDIIKQVDLVHVITTSEPASLSDTSKMIGELCGYCPEVEGKIYIVTTEYGKEPIAGFAERFAALKRNIFATLPDMSKKTDKTSSAVGTVIISRPQCGYSRTVRRLARQIGAVRLGLALGSGAALGLAHIGILKVLEEEGVTIDVLAGTSMGALVGGLWASGKSAADIEDIIGKFRRKIENIKLMDFTFPRSGMLKGIVVRNFLQKHFGDRTFYDLKLPFRVVACDIETRQEVVIDKGGLVDAVLASISVPGVFEPVRLDGKILVDGGIINPVPTNVLSLMGINKIIAVNTLPSPDDVVRSKKKVTNIFDIIVNSVQAGEYILAEMSCQNADVAMHPIVPTMDWYEFFKLDLAIARGEEEAKRFLPAIRELVSQ